MAAIRPTLWSRQHDALARTSAPDPADLAAAAPPAASSEADTTQTNEDAMRRWVTRTAHKKAISPKRHWRTGSRSKAIWWTSGQRLSVVRRGGIRSGIRSDVTDVGLGWRNRPWW